jgi:hypothetical protein
MPLSTQILIVATARSLGLLQRSSVDCVMSSRACQSGVRSVISRTPRRSFWCRTISIPINPHRCARQDPSSGSNGITRQSTAVGSIWRNPNSRCSYRNASTAASPTSESSSIKSPHGRLTAIPITPKPTGISRPIAGGNWSRGFLSLPPPPIISFASRRFWPQRDESVWSVEDEATIYRIPHMQRGSSPTSPFVAIENIEKFDLTTSFFSSLLVSTGGCISPASSSMPIASRPARVMIRLMRPRHQPAVVDFPGFSTSRRRTLPASMRGSVPQSLSADGPYLC